MCGIFGYIGENNVAPILFEGLKKLEYRGYDSAGVAVISQNNLVVKKTVGKIHQLAHDFQQKPFSGKIGIGHTRWATHGRVTQANCHPFVDCQNSLAVVHNGIIENYLELKKSLIKKGHKFVSETDSEVIAHLIEEKSRELPFIEAARQAFKELKGAFAVIVISKKAPLMLLARRGSSLILGIGRGEYFISSDLPALAGKAEEIISLADEEMAVITARGIQVKNFDGLLVFKKPEKILLENFPAEKNGFEHFMLKEIHEQPQVVAHIFKKRVGPKLNEIYFPELKFAPAELKKIKRIILTGCGTSWHAALIAEYWLEQYLRIPVEVEYGAEFRYRQPVIDKNSLVMAISQSGETADTLAALAEAKKNGARVLAICNVETSLMAKEADAVIFSMAGQEIGVASTKAFTSQLVNLYLLALYLGQVTGKINRWQLQKNLQELATLSYKIEKILSCESHIQKIAEKIFKATNALYLGRGKCFPVALEGALKLKEVSYVHAEGYPASEMKHGPIALIDNQMPVVVLTLAGKRYEKILSNVEEVKARGGYVIAIATQGDAVISRKADAVFSVPETSEDLSPILGVVPLQLLAYYIALKRGSNVDQPRNLAKSVTVE